MLAQGTPLHVVSEILGHASIMITKDITDTCSKGTAVAVAGAGLMFVTASMLSLIRLREADWHTLRDALLWSG